VVYQIHASGMDFGRAISPDFAIFCAKSEGHWGAGSLCLGVLILGVAGSQGKLVPATMSRSMETNLTKRGICEEEKWVSE
jgi:hypothetical protein